MLLPILVVWGVSFRAFDLYRPRRIGSHLSEAADIAKASSLGALVLVAVMTFFFRGYDYSRVVIVYFWLLSIAAVWFSRAAFREALRFARRRGYNLRYAVVVGDGELAATVVQRMHGAARRGHPGARGRGRRQGRHGRGAPARRLRRPAGGARRPHGGPRDPGPRATRTTGGSAGCSTRWATSR